MNSIHVKYPRAAHLFSLALPVVALITAALVSIGLS